MYTKKQKLNHLRGHLFGAPGETHVRGAMGYRDHESHLALIFDEGETVDLEESYSFEVIAHESARQSADSISEQIERICSEKGTLPDKVRYEIQHDSCWEQLGGADHRRSYSWTEEFPFDDIRHHLGKVLGCPPNEEIVAISLPE